MKVPISQTQVDTDLGQVVKTYLEDWAKKERKRMRISIYTSTGKFLPLPLKNQYCRTFVHLLNPNKGMPIFEITLRRRQGLVITEAIADIVAREVLVGINSLLLERKWFRAEVS